MPAETPRDRVTLLELLEGAATDIDIMHAYRPDRAPARSFAAKLRAAAERLRSAYSSSFIRVHEMLDYINSAGPLSPSPATGTGMKPGQRCTWIEHYESTPHRHSARDEREWNGREFSAAAFRRCPYIEPTPPPATCGRCGGDGLAWSGGHPQAPPCVDCKGTGKKARLYDKGINRIIPCPTCAPPVPEKRCETCGDPLPPREPYNYVPFMLDGQVMTKRCPTCHPTPPTPAKEGP